MERLRSQKLGRVTTDTFVNFAAKVGIGTANLSTGNTYGFNPISRNRTLVEWMYRGSWICGQGVDCIADDMTREWIDLEGLDPDDMVELMAMMRSMQIPQSFNLMSKWGRLYGGAVNIIVIEGQRLDTPLRIETVKAGQFKGLVTLDRWMLTPDLNTAVQVPGPDFGLPEYYTIDAQTPNLPIPRQRVHYTRLFRQEGVELPFWQKQSENMWGISVLERLYDRLTAFDSSTQGAAQQMFRAYYRTLSVEGLRDIIAAGGKAYDALIKNIEMIRLYQSNEGFTLLDAKDKFESHQNTFAGQSDLINAFGEQISGALATPMTRLFGQSPSGMNTDGESGMRTYEDNVNRQQERWYRRPLDVVIPLCAINAKVELTKGWTYQFVSLRQMTEEEKADTNTKDTNAAVQAYSTGVLPSAVFLKELKASGKRTGRWQSITQQDIKDAEVNDLVPTPSELGLGAPVAGAEASGETGGAASNPDRVTKGTGTADRAVLMDVQELPIFIETHMGMVRKGPGWQTVMPADYGFIEGVASAEGHWEQMDCYIGPSLDAPNVYIIDQVFAGDGGWDEHKCMIGFDNAKQARATYLRAFSDGKGAQRLKDMVEVPMDRFKQWLKNGDHTMPAKGQF